MTNIYIWGLVLWHWVTEAAWTALEIGKKTVKGVLDAHTPEYWLFHVRNSIPHIVKEGSEEGYGEALRWSTGRGCFERAATATTRVYKKFDDVIDIQLYDSEKEESTDLSSFFHFVQWATDSPPTLSEIVIIWHMMEKRPFNLEDLKQKSLKVFTIEDPDLTILLGDCTTPFTEWAGLRKST